MSTIKKTDFIIMGILLKKSSIDKKFNQYL